MAMEKSPEMQYTNIQCQNSLVLDPVMQSVYVASHTRYEGSRHDEWVADPSFPFFRRVRVRGDPPMEVLDAE
jgi:hypothetical protein